MVLDVTGPHRLRDGPRKKLRAEHGATCPQSDAASVARERTLSDLSIAGGFLLGVRKAGFAGYRRGC